VPARICQDLYDLYGLRRVGGRVVDVGPVRRESFVNLWTRDGGFQLYFCQRAPHRLPIENIPIAVVRLVGQVQILRRPQRMVQIGDALAEDRTTRVNAEIGAGEALLCPSAFVGVLGGIGILGNRRRKRAILSVRVCADAVAAGVLKRLSVPIAPRAFCAVQHADRYRSRAVSALLEILRTHSGL
jgi:hypothetical protein